MLRRKNARHLRVLEARRGEEIALDRARFGAPISPEAIVTSTNHGRTDPRSTPIGRGGGTSRTERNRATCPLALFRSGD